MPRLDFCGLKGARVRGLLKKEESKLVFAKKLLLRTLCASVLVEGLRILPASLFSLLCPDPEAACSSCFGTLVAGAKLPELTLEKEFETSRFGLSESIHKWASEGRTRGGLRNASSIFFSGL